MSRGYQTDPSARRAQLLDAVEAVRPVLAAHMEESEALCTLPQPSVDALTTHGLLAMKCPAVLGGAEADPLTQMEVIEGVAYTDPAAGWCVCIGNGAISLIGAFLPEAGAARVFSGARPPRMAAAVMPGSAARVDGGYRVSGRWSWASGVRHAEWVGGVALVETTAGAAPEPVMMTFPRQAVTVHDNWDPVGLRGSGSCDFSVADVFVPDELSFSLAAWEPQRGGPLYRLGLPGLLINELAAFALGVGRRAQDVIVELAASRRRGYGPKAALAEREVFQRAVAENDLRLRAARGLVFEVFERTWQTVQGGSPPSTADQHEMSAVTTYAVDAALAATDAAFRYAGGAAVSRASVLQRCLRDMHTAAVHLLVSDVSYERYGKCLLGQPLPPAFG